MKALFDKYRQFVLYCIIGGSGVVVDLAIFSLGMEILRLNYQVANFVSFSCANASNFTLNALFNFKVKDCWPLRFACFYGVGLFSWFLGAGCLYALFEKAGLVVYVAKGISILIVTAVQFTLNKTISFRKRIRGADGKRA